jgi:DNA helicase HerA-like ATPase
LDDKEDKNRNQVEKIDNEICKKIDDFLKGNKKILRIDLSGFTSKHQSKELLINFLSNYIFTKRKKDKNNEKGMEDSVILCIDEAHNFLNKTMKYTDTEKKLDAVDIIAKEGRKYGLNLMLATQRTQDIPEDILSQIGFIISHKLTNEDDLRLIKNAISYMDETIMQAIPMLQTGHAFLLCSELKFPRQVIISQPSNQPQSESKKWSKKKNS